LLQTQCIIRDYAQGTDTCSVELTGLGVVEAWMDGVALASSVDRSLVVFGAQAIVNLPDLHRLCNATVIEVYGQAAQAVVGVPAATTGAVTTQTGRQYIFTDASGNASGTVTFPVAFVSAPQVSITGDSVVGYTVSSVTNTGFNFHLTAARAAYTWLAFTWTARGN